MEIKDLISIIKNEYKEKSIIIPQFSFNGETISDTEFVRMGITPDGKEIYQSLNCLSNIRIIMQDLLTIDGIIERNKGVGECDICKKAEESLDAEVFKILGKHLKPYKRFYNSRVSTEKIFLPLACEVFGKSEYSPYLGKSYPQWDGYKVHPEYKIKQIRQNASEEVPWFWWTASSVNYYYGYCTSSAIGELTMSPLYGKSGVSIAFCV